MPLNSFLSAAGDFGVPQLVLLNGSTDPADPAGAIVGLIMFLIVLVVVLAIYFLPTGIAMLRSHPNFTPIFLVNLLLGWICIGWIVALIWSFTAIDQNKSYR
jgi:ABC-type sugar transport system permease subunit